MLSAQPQTLSLIPKPRDSGILGLIADASTLDRKLHTLDEAIRLTDGLAHSSHSLRIPLARFVNDALRSSDLGRDACQQAISMLCDSRKHALTP